MSRTPTAEELELELELEVRHWKMKNNCALLVLQRGEREDEKFRAHCAERKKAIERLQQRVKESHKDIEKTRELRFSGEILRKVDEANRAVEKAEREKKEVLQREAEIERLHDERATLEVRKKELQDRLQKYSVYKDIMERVCKLTKFKDVDALEDHLENVLHFRDKFFQNEVEAQEQLDKQRKTFQRLEDQHNLMLLQKNNELTRLNVQLEKSQAETLIWERNWNHIRETAAEKTLELGQIKVATLNLFEGTGGTIGEKGVDINDTKTQLDLTQLFIKDHEDIVKQHQAFLQRLMGGLKSEKRKKKVKKK
ncbi:coiled-coil domain-containing protein 42-like [Mugil cephalus]|uniref:coiled-coil domain-containing protein 42-like n=1 Tax=Mugil cephalus TaxID=48193 RepID=UPI001FB81E3F|nr:coiled-coil domain-containing protein 42-like [Mugil cephalus]